jgi:tRNA modification GTPase
VVAVVLEEPGGVLEVEIQCHGGQAAVSLVVEAMQATGVKHRSAEQWQARRAASPLRGQANADLGNSETIRAALVLLDQSAGALDEAITRLVDRIEVDPGRVAEELVALIRRGILGTRLLTGWRVVLAGRPNVGKSRLLNALAGYGRSIVSPTPGTTRDVVTVRTAIDGWPVELADTAGLRATDDPIESGGVTLARARQVGADLVLLVLDRSEPLTEADRGLLAGPTTSLIVCNKADLPASWEPEESWGEVAIVSADRGDGLDHLLDRVARRLVPDPLPKGTAVPFRAEQLRGLGRSHRLLQGGRVEGAKRALLRLQRRGC